MLFAIVNGAKVEAKPQSNGVCPLCERTVFSKCGEINVWHWAHHKDDSCDKAHDKDYNHDIALKLLELRKSRGYTSYENFCWENDFPTRTYFRMENGENTTMKNLLRVLKIFEITPEEFFKGIR
jgi:hypothetical protein